MSAVIRIAPPSAFLATVMVLAGVTHAWAQGAGWNGQPGANRYANAGGDAPSRYGAAATPAPVTPIPGVPAPAVGRPASNAGLTPIGSNGPTRARVTSKTPNKLPGDHGQVWREYDIRPYTLRAGGIEKPEQVIVDWVLRETGYEAWHSEPLGLLSAGRETLRVYHTPQMQEVVAGIVDRFVNSQARQRAFTLRIATVRSPSWRAKAMTYMTPIPVQSPGLQAWVMPKENAAILLSDLTKRSDYREHAASNQLVLNGQRLNLSTMRPRQYIKGVVRTPNQWPGFQPETGSLEEGASLQFSPLLSLDTATADAVVKIRINQVEKMTPVTLDIPTQVSGNQRMEVQAPQMTMAQVHERFRWPADQVLLLSLGVVPPPTPSGGAGGALMKMLPGGNSPARADGLLMIDVKGTAIPGAAPGGGPAATTALQPGAFSGRY